MRKLLHWMFSHWLTSCFILAAGSIFGFLLITDWAAENAWEKYCQAARSRGVKLSLAELSSPSIVDEENFGALPMFRRGKWEIAEFPRWSRGAPPNIPNPVERKPLDWETFWADYQKTFVEAHYIGHASENGPRDVLLALEHYRQHFEEWRQWRQRPMAQFDHDKQGQASEILIDTSNLFNLRMRANLALGDSKSARGDFQDAFQSYLATRNDPYFSVAGTGCLMRTISSMAQGLSEERWEIPELESIQADLEKVQIWKSYAYLLSCRRAIFNGSMDEVVKEGPSKREMIFTSLSDRLIPTRWMSIASYAPRFAFRLNQLHENVAVDEFVARTSPDQTHYNPNLPTPSSAESIDTIPSHIALIIFYERGLNDISITRLFERGAGRLDRAILACALERYRRDVGTFPESLESLTPNYVQSIPIDIYSGKPMIYRRVEGDSFILYSVGRNRKDDGGVVDPARSEGGQMDDIWFYAPPPRVKTQPQSP